MPFFAAPFAREAVTEQWMQRGRSALQVAERNERRRACDNENSVIF